MQRVTRCQAGWCAPSHLEHAALTGASWTNQSCSRGNGHEELHEFGTGSVDPGGADVAALLVSDVLSDLGHDVGAGLYAVASSALGLGHGLRHGIRADIGPRRHRSRAGGDGGGLGDVAVCICMLKPSVAVMKQRLARSAFVASVQQSGGYRRRCIAKLM